MSLTLVSMHTKHSKDKMWITWIVFLQNRVSRSQQTIQHEANWGNFRYDSSKRIIESIAGAGAQVTYGAAIGGPAGAIGREELEQEYQW